MPKHNVKYALFFFFFKWKPVYLEKYTFHRQNQSTSEGKSGLQVQGWLVFMGWVIS